MVDFTIIYTIERGEVTNLVSGGEVFVMTSTR